MLAYYETTTACNCHCAHCLLGDATKTPQSKSFPDIAADFSRLRALGVEKITLSGGEPTLRLTLPEIVEYANRHFRQVNVISNCTKPDMIQKIATMANVWVSLDYYGERQDKWRGFPGIWQNYRKVENQVNVRTTLLHDNLDDIYALLQHVSNTKKEITIVPYRGNRKDLQPTAIDITQLIVNVINNSTAKAVIDDPSVRAFITSQLPELAATTSGFIGCYACQNTIKVKINGKVTPCPFIDQEIGDLYDADLLNKMAQARENLLQRLSGKCLTCSQNKICDGCKASDNEYCPSI